MWHMDGWPNGDEEDDEDEALQDKSIGPSCSGTSESTGLGMEAGLLDLRISLVGGDRWYGCRAAWWRAISG